MHTVDLVAYKLKGHTTVPRLKNTSKIPRLPTHIFPSVLASSSKSASNFCSSSDFHPESASTVPYCNNQRRIGPFWADSVSFSNFSSDLNPVFRAFLARLCFSPCLNFCSLNFLRILLLSGRPFSLFELLFRFSAVSARCSAVSE